MLFRETRLAGAYIIDVERHEDERGFFARSWCENEFREHGLDPRLVQCNISYSRRRGTVRGMHFQRPPYAEAKLIRCTKGRIYDVIIDLRPGSPTYREHLAVQLSATNRKMIYVPAGFAHGFQGLEDATEVFYQMSQRYMPDAADSVRWNDPAFAIHWPLSVQVISVRDQSYADFRHNAG